jgi:hypothetical protein
MYPRSIWLKVHLTITYIAHGPINTKKQGCAQMKLRTIPNYKYAECHAPLQKGCPKHHGHKGDPGVTPGTCGAGGEKVQVILVWDPRALGTPPTHGD